MKRYCYILFFSIICYVASAQEKLDYSAILLNLDGMGNYTRGSVQSRLEIPQSYISGDKLSMHQGDALIMLFNGEEIELTVGSEVLIPNNIKVESKEVKDLAKGSNLNHGLMTQSGAAYSLRGKNNTIPSKSKIINPEKVFLMFQYENNEEINLSLKLIDSQTQKILYQRDSITDTIVYLSDVPFVQGKSYYWTISGTPDNRPGMGVLEYSKELEIKKLRTFDSFKSNLDYLTAISYYHNKGYFYEAYELIQKAMAIYPELDIYKILLNNLMAE
jgi:hypothetical protein